MLGFVIEKKKGHGIQRDIPVGVRQTLRVSDESCIPINHFFSELNMLRTSHPADRPTLSDS